MKFKELTPGCTVYCITITDSVIADNKIKAKKVTEIYTYSVTDNIEIHFDDDTMIIPQRDEDYIIRGIVDNEKLSSSLSFMVYSTSYDKCYNKAKNIIKDKLNKTREEYTKINTQLAKLHLMNATIDEIGATSIITVEPIYAD